MMKNQGCVVQEWRETAVETLQGQVEAAQRAGGDTPWVDGAG
ncbi:MAG: hypothetical protein ACOX2L_00760 [Anaerolineae bacterium]|jgi:hypothetical protein